jgi:hypothetical protein
MTASYLRRRRRSLALRPAAAALLLTAALGVSLGAARIIRVAPLVRDGQIHVSFEMADAFTDEVRDAIQSGLTTTFVYEIGLRRATTFWVDRTIASTRIATSVRYDNLTRRYQVMRTQDGRVEASRALDDETLVRRWLTEFERFPLFSTTPLEPNVEYYVRVRALTRPRGNLFFLPWEWDREAASAVGKFTFIP